MLHFGLMFMHVVKRMLILPSGINTHVRKMSDSCHTLIRFASAAHDWSHTDTRFVSRVHDWSHTVTRFVSHVHDWGHTVTRFTSHVHNWSHTAIRLAFPVHHLGGIAPSKQILPYSLTYTDQHTASFYSPQFIFTLKNIYP